ncbi:MAG: ABC transporter permease [Opitutales bacterium]|nr:ABC transporter permease [Opitutales bacterium]
MTVAALIYWGYTRYPYYLQDITLGSVAPSFDHWFGTDPLGRDLFSRVIYACGISLAVGFAATALAVGLGGIYGTLSGYYGGWLDQLLMGGVDVMYPIPLTLIVILLMILFGQNVAVLFIAIGCVKWMTTARIVRSEVLKLRETGYVQVARGLGETTAQILRWHIVPNLRRILLTCFAVTLPGVILLESFLSFIGLGIQPPQSSLGILISEGARHIGVHPWEVLFPSLTMIAIIFALTSYGQKLQGE